MMRHYVSFSTSLVAVAALVFCAASGTHAQNPAPAPANGGYVSSDPLANVRYDNRYEMSLAPAYQHIKAGPNVLQGANIGGLDLDATYWLSQHWAVEGTGRSYLGTSGAAPNTLNIRR